ncbi:MAG: fumarate hydratase, partial [Lachnospiraceae bacterium]|nr:fumarate hydratase [Lachnospiraceae bacterium]
MRIFQTQQLTDHVREMCIEANYTLSPDMRNAIESAAKTESNGLGRVVLEQLVLNMEIAQSENIPICQDTGMAVIFLQVGQDVFFEGGSIEDAIQEGVRQGYEQGFLRKSIVKDPILRENTGDNTPAVIHYFLVPGDKVEITVAPKGFGSENTSRIYMLKPADGLEGVREAILRTVEEAGANACPPMVAGVGVGGTFEKCAMMAKQALLLPIGERSTIPYVSQLETELLEQINHSQIGP